MTIEEEACQMCGTVNRGGFRSRADGSPVMRHHFECSSCGAVGFISRHRSGDILEVTGPYFGTNQQEIPMTDDTNDTTTTETVHSGVSIKGKLTRGEGTRDQDTLVIKGKGADSDEAVEEFEETLKKAEKYDWVERLRQMQPDADDGEDDR